MKPAALSMFHFAFGCHHRQIEHWGSERVVGRNDQPSPARSIRLFLPGRSAFHFGTPWGVSRKVIDFEQTGILWPLIFVIRADCSRGLFQLAYSRAAA